MNKKLGTLVLLCAVASTMTQGFGTTTAFAADSSDKGITTSVINTKDGEEGNYKYSIAENQLTITKYLGKDKNIEIPDEINGVKVTAIGQEAFKDNGIIESVVIPEGVRSILSASFNCCNNLKKVVLPQNLDYLGDCAFMNCKNLEDVTMPVKSKGMGNSVFCNCNKLTQISIPSGVTTIGLDFAKGCSSLTEVTIPDTVETILSGSFQGCTTLREVAIPSSVNRIEAPFQDLKHIIIAGEKGSAAEKYATGANFQFKDVNKKVEDDSLDKENASSDFKYILNSKEAEIISYIGEKEDVVVPDTIEGVKVTSIGSDAFKDNNKIKSVKLPDSVEIINSSAFENCTSLVNVNIPENVTVINESAFKDCSLLDNVELNEKLETIGYNAFDGCISIKAINIPSSVRIVEINSFDNCTNLEEINVSKDNNYYSSVDGILYAGEGTNLLKCPDGYKKDNIKINSKVVYIRFGAFSNAKKVKTLEFDGEKINIISVTDLITEKVKEQNLTGIDLNKDTILSVDNLEKVSKAAKRNESFSIKIGDNNEAVIVSENIVPKNNDKDINADLDNDSKIKENDDNQKQLATVKDKDTVKNDDTGKTADLSSPLSLVSIMSLMGASIIKALKTKRN